MNRRALLTGAAVLASYRALAQPVPAGGKVGSQRLGPGPLSVIGGSLPPSLDLRFTTGPLDPRITFSRASVGTYFDGAGVLQTATANAPRLDSDPVTHAARGLLIEEQRQNAYLQSGDFTNAAWVKINATLVAGVAGPNGATTGSGVVSGSGVIGNIQQTATVTAGTTYTASAFAKAASLTSVQISLPGGWWADVGVRFAIFNLANGTVSSQGGAGANPAIVPVGNGWYRIILTATPDTSGSASPQIVRATATGDGATVQLYAWGAQFEAGAFATSWIPTTAASVTRSADVATMPTSPWFSNPLAMTLAVDAMLPAAGGTSCYAQIDDGSNNNRSQIITDSATNLRLFENSASVTSLNTVGLGSLTAGVPFKAATTSISGAHGGALNGNANASVGTSANNPPAVTALRIGKQISATTGSFYVSRFRYWPRALSSAELQQVTT